MSRSSLDDRSTPIKSERLLKVTQCLHSDFGYEDEPYLTTATITDSDTFGSSSYYRESALLEEILKTAFDGTTGRIFFAESKEGFRIFYFDTQDQFLASILFNRPNIPSFRELLESLAWKVEDGTTTAPVFYYRFETEEGPLEGAVMYSPSQHFPDGSVLTTIDIIRTESPLFISNEVFLEDDPKYFHYTRSIDPFERATVQLTGEMKKNIGKDPFPYMLQTSIEV